jgi:hypothetical protein
MSDESKGLDVPFALLTGAEQLAIRQALNALAFGPFISDWEVPFRCHVDRAGYQSILSRWPDLDDSRGSDVYYAINGALNACCHGYEMERAPWAEWFTVTREQLVAVYERWDSLHEAREVTDGRAG